MTKLEVAENLDGAKPFEAHEATRVDGPVIDASDAHAERLAHNVSSQLSAEEAKALREIVQPKAPFFAPLARSQMGADLLPHVSLAAADKQARRKLPALSRRMVDLTERVRALMICEMRQPCPMTAASPELAGPKVMRDEVDAWLAGIILTLPTGEPLALLGMMPRFGYHMIEVAFGAPNSPSPKVLPKRRLTQLERQTLWPLLEQLGRLLAMALAPHIALGENGVRIEALPHPLEMPKLATDEAGVVTSLSFPLGQETAQIGMVIAPKAMDLVADTEAALIEGHKSPLSAQEMMTAHLYATEVTLVANLGKARIDLPQVAQLTVGHTVWLDQNKSDALALLVEGEPKFLAQPMQRSGAVGVQIVSRL